MRRNIILFSSLVLAATAFAADASDRLPFTIQGKFGRSDKVELSVRSRNSDKSTWIKLGESYEGWKFQSQSASGNKMVFTNGTQSVEVMLAMSRVSSPSWAATGARMSSEEYYKMEAALRKFSVFNKFMECTADPEAMSALRKCEAAARDKFKKIHGFDADERENLSRQESVSEVELRIRELQSCDDVSLKPYKNVWLAIEMEKRRALEDGDLIDDAPPSAERAISHHARVEQIYTELEKAGR